MIAEGVQRGGFTAEGAENFVANGLVIIENYGQYFAETVNTEC